MEAFESMLATARSVADQLNGELRDDQRNVLTGQATEHNRQRIRDFEMQLRKRAR
jgi:cell division protein ZipA